MEQPQNPYQRRDGHRRQSGKNSALWEAWQAGYERRLMPRHPNDIADAPPIKKGDPIDSTSVVGRAYRKGDKARTDYQIAILYGQDHFANLQTLKRKGFLR
jgi:hypothetical protein